MVLGVFVDVWLTNARFHHCLLILAIRSRGLLLAHDKVVEDGAMMV